MTSSALFGLPLASSPISSKCVPSVLQEPSAEERLLRGGEGGHRKASGPGAPSALDIVLSPPIPFSKLGVVEDAVDVLLSCTPYPELLGLADGRRVPTGGDFGSCIPAASLVPGLSVVVDRGLGGRLDRRVPLGGCGNAPILMVFRSVLPGVGRADGLAGGAARVGTLDVECTLVLLSVGNEDRVTEREGVGVGKSDVKSTGNGTLGRGLLFLVFGRGGNGPDGGASGGLEGRCIVVVTVTDMGSRPVSGGVEDVPVPVPVPALVLVPSVFVC